MDTKETEEIKTHPAFEALFPINPALLEKIQQDMRDGSYDFSQPIILATWEGQKEPVCIDGHTRLQAAINAGIEQVPVWLHEFVTEEEALEKAIKLQSNRRNMTDTEIAKCIEVLDRRKPRGGDRRSEAEKSKRQLCPIENGNPSSAQETGDLLGISERKVRQARTVMDHADETTKEAVKEGDLSINQAYEATQKKRRETKKTPAQDHRDSKSEPVSGASWPAPVLKSTANAAESSPPKNDFPTSLGNRVTVYLPDWQYNGLLHLCSGYVESHVCKAVDLYLESLGIEAEEDDDDEIFDPDTYEAD
jgi:ParB-like chromosome segregation protein Spo0J